MGQQPKTNTDVEDLASCVHSALLSSTHVAQKETCTHTSSQCFHLEIYISQLLGSKYIFARQPPMRCRQEDLPFEFAKTAQLEKILEFANNASVLLAFYL